MDIRLSASGALLVVVTIRPSPYGVSTTLPMGLGHVGEAEAAVVDEGPQFARIDETGHLGKYLAVPGFARAVDHGHQHVNDV